MRPLRLSLSHFGPYGAGQVVDFADLGPHRLFLIAGPTGAGKTSLVDAICFAPFGESSGSESAASDLRARHAPPDEPTEVAFEFEQVGRRYRIARTPAWERPRKRGEGFTSERMRVSLVELGRDDSPAERDDEVARRVAAILGLTAAEFRQTVLLPQRRFRELLVAPADTRRSPAASKSVRVIATANAMIAPCPQQAKRITSRPAHKIHRESEIPAWRMSGRGRHARHVASDRRRAWERDRLRPAQRGRVDPLAMEARARGRTAVAQPRSTAGRCRDRRRRAEPHGRTRHASRATRRLIGTFKGL